MKLTTTTAALCGVLCFATLVPAAGAETLTTFAALWNAESPEHELHFAESAAQLLALQNDLAAEGLQLVDLEVWHEHGEPRYGALFLAAEGEHQVFLDLDPAAFKAKSTELLGKGLRLRDVETWYDDGARRFAAVWERGSGKERRSDGLTPSRFLTLHGQLGPTYRLVDFETYLDDQKTLRILAVWRQGAGPAEEIAVDLAWPSFRDLVHERAEEGSQLFDIEAVHLDGDDIRYSGRWRSGNAADWLGVRLDRFQLTKADNNLRAGFGTSGLDNPSDSLVGEPTGEPLRLEDLEVLRVIELDGSITQGEPLHNSGTAGPPP